jgi:hypothetical protein
LHVVRRRIEGICHAADVDFSRLDVHVITAVSLRLDLEDHGLRLTDTLAALSPRLFVLDPFVRLHRMDENASGEVAPLLAFLRELQRRFRTAVVLVHHARKGGARAGQALRGSSEFHAWGESNLYLRRTHDGRLVLSVEQHAAPSIAALALDLHTDGDRLALQIAADKAPHAPPPLDPAERILNALAAAHSLVPLAEIREACRIRTARPCQELAALVDAGRVLKAEGGYVLAPPSS